MSRPTSLIVSLSLAEAQRLHVINGCKEQPVWIAATSNSGLADSIRIEAGGQHDFDVDGVPNGQRYWPKFGCGSDGQQCSVGDSGGPGQTCGAAGCAPPLDSKFEITVSQDQGIDWWDTSAVDGYTVPFKVELDGCGTQSPNIDCSHLSMDDCPTEDIQNVGPTQLKLVHPETKETVGCYSPCAKLTTRNWGNPDGTHTPADSIGQPYCCPTWTPEQCRAGPSASMQFTKSIHANCPHTYAYSYDDADGLHTCPIGTHYTWTVYCPSGAAPGPSPTPTPSPAPTPSPSPTPTPSPSPTPSGWQPCSGGVCCDPHASPAQLCPGGEQCQECGAGACQCPGAVVV